MVPVLLVPSLPTAVVLRPAMNIVSRRASVQAGLSKKEISVAMSNGIVQLYSHGSASLVIAVHSHSPQLRGRIVPLADLGVRKPVKLREVVRLGPLLATVRISREPEAMPEDGMLPQSG